MTKRANRSASAGGRWKSDSIRCAARAGLSGEAGVDTHLRPSTLFDAADPVAHHLRATLVAVAVLATLTAGCWPRCGLRHFSFTRACDWPRSMQDYGVGPKHFWPDMTA